MTNKSYTLEKNPQFSRYSYQTFFANWQYPKSQAYQIWWSNSAFYWRKKATRNVVSGNIWRTLYCKFRAIILARVMGGTIWGCHFNQRCKFNNWYYWSLSLFQYFLLKNMKKREMQDKTRRQHKNTILRGHEQALVLVLPRIFLKFN